MGIPFCQHWIWLDGYVVQLKDAHVFQWLSLLNIKYKVPHLWRYFETRHRKGKHDGVGDYTSKGRDEVYRTKT